MLRATTASMTSSPQMTRPRRLRRAPRPRVREERSTDAPVGDGCERILGRRRDADEGAQHGGFHELVDRRAIDDEREVTVHAGEPPAHAQDAAEQPGADARHSTKVDDDGPATAQDALERRA